MDDLRPEPKEGFERACRALEAAGAVLEPFEMAEVAEANASSGILFTSEAYGLWKDVIEAAPEKMFPEILERFRGGKAHAAADFVAAWERLHAIRALWHARTAGFDAVILPTAPILPPEAERMLSDHDYYVRENLLALRNTRVGNLMGLCGLTLPTGVPSAGLMILGAPGTEEALLRLGKGAETALS